MSKFQHFLDKVAKKFFNNESAINDNHDGNTPLHIMAKLGDFKKVKSLLEDGANPEARNDKNETPMDIIKKYEVLADNTISWNHVITADILAHYIVNDSSMINLEYICDNKEHLFETHLLGITYYDNEGVPHTDV